MAKYKKRPDGRYATSTIVGYTDDGKPKRKTLYGRTIMELDKKVAEFKSLQNKGIIINDEGMTVEQWGIKWLKLYKSAKEYKHLCNVFKRPKFAHYTRNRWYSFKCVEVTSYSRNVE